MAFSFFYPPPLDVVVTFRNHKNETTKAQQIEIVIKSLCCGLHVREKQKGKKKKLYENSRQFAFFPEQNDRYLSSFFLRTCKFKIIFNEV
jgi:hypothetical protein